MAAEVALDAPPAWWRFLREELSARPGRVGAVARITFCCTAIVVVWMVFRIPLAAYAAYLVFLVRGAESTTTLVTAIGGGLAATFAVMLTLVLYLLDAGEPALRLPLMAAATFLGMFLSRVISIGPIAFLVGFLLVIMQTLIDDLPSMEVLTNYVLWLWLIVAAPAVLFMLVDVAFGQDPARLARDNVRHVLEVLEDALARGDGADLASAATMTDGLAELHRRAELTDRSIASRHPLDLRLIETLDELVRVTSLMPRSAPAAVRTALAVACAGCGEAVRHSRAPSITATALPEPAVRALDRDARPVVLAASSLLDRLLAGLAERAGASNGAPAAKEPKAFLVPDAFTNPEHVRFALKSTLAVMLVYILYSAVDWSEIRTSVVTCFFVALGSVGETIHKLTLRLSGAIVGGILGVLCIVFVLPHLTDIGGIALAIAAVSALGAWIATSSERLSYFGMQLAFAFFIGVLQGSRPTEELTVLRDRVLGILLGNIAMSVVFMTIWPVSAVTQARAKLGEALAALARLLRHPADGGRRAVAQALEQARRLLSISAFESTWIDRDGRHAVREQLAGLDRQTAATFVVVEQPRFADIDVAWREAAAASLESRRPVPSDDMVATRLAALPDAAPSTVRAALESQLVLSAEMRSAASHAA